MRAVVCEHYGQPELLDVHDIPTPKIGPDELLVRVHASSVNFPDTLTIQGLYQVKHAVPFVPGSEAAGFVEEVGSAVTGFAPGDRVAVLTRVGAFAEKVAAPALTAVRLPDSVPLDFAAAFNITYGTAYLALCLQAALKAGETVLVLGAAGGVGLAAIEIAKTRGATVIAAASSPEKLAVARESGADACINYGQEDLRAAIRELTGGRGVNVVVDPVGDAFAEPAMRSLAWQGRYLVIGFAAGQIPRIPLNLLLLKSASAIGTFWGDWAARHPQVNAANIADIFGMYIRGDIKARITQRFSLEQTSAALRCMMDRKANGKLLIEIDDR